MFAAGNCIYIQDTEGRKFIDCLANAGAPPLEHNRPEIKDAVLEHLFFDQLQQALDLATPAKFGFLQERPDLHVRFCAG
jgi:diaminobutyrate-2-oxoglutarate transaminase